MFWVKITLFNPIKSEYFNHWLLVVMLQLSFWLDYLIDWFIDWLVYYWKSSRQIFWRIRQLIFSILVNNWENQTNNVTSIELQAQLFILTSLLLWGKWIKHRSGFNHCWFWLLLRFDDQKNFQGIRSHSSFNKKEASFGIFCLYHLC